MNDNSTFHTSHQDFFLTRRSFFRHSGAAILATTVLSSCSDLVDDIFKKNEGPVRDRTLAFFGDSLTVSIGGSTPYGNIVGAAMGDRPVATDGIVGQYALNIAARQGGVPLKIRVEGGKFDGISPVKITKLSNLFLTTFSNNAEYSRSGTIGDVRCTITRIGSIENGEMYSIKPDTASVMDIPDDSEFLLEDANKLRTATQILWYGRNNIGKGKPGAEEEIMTALETSIAHITTPARYIVLGVLLGTAEEKGTEKHNQVVALNDKLAAKYGELYVPMTPPTNAEMTAIGYSPTAEDVVDLEKQNFPRGMRQGGISEGRQIFDDIHLNDKGYQIVANRVVSKLKALKY